MDLSLDMLKGSDVTFVDESVSEEQADIPSIISLGRLIQKGIKLEWNTDGAVMVLPNKRKIAIPVQKIIALMQMKRY